MPTVVRRSPLIMGSLLALVLCVAVFSNTHLSDSRRLTANFIDQNLPPGPPFYAPLTIHWDLSSYGYPNGYCLLFVEGVGDVRIDGVSGSYTFTQPNNSETGVSCALLDANNKPKISLYDRAPVVQQNPNSTSSSGGGGGTSSSRATSSSRNSSSRAASSPRSSSVISSSSSVCTPDLRYTVYSSTSPLSWQQAEASCVSKGGHLATILSDIENNMAYAALNNKPNVWIGLNDIQKEGEYRWTSGLPFAYSKYAWGQPNGRFIDYGVAANDCTFMNHQSARDTWHDVGCNDPAFPVQNYLCETGSRCGLPTSSASSVTPQDPRCSTSQDDQPSILILNLQPLPFATSADPIEVSDLKNMGYSVTYHTRVSLPTFSSAFINQFDALWVMNGCGDQSAALSATELSAVQNFYLNNKHLLLLSGGNLNGKKPTDCLDCASRVNQIGAQLGLQFEGVTNQTDNCVPVQSTDTLMTGVTKVYRKNFSTMTLLSSAPWGNDRPAFVGSVLGSQPAFALTKATSSHGAAVFLPQDGGFQQSCSGTEWYYNIFKMMGYKPGCNLCTQ